jgi:hypothetical protein
MLPGRRGGEGTAAAQDAPPHNPPSACVQASVLSSCAVLQMAHASPVCFPPLDFGAVQPRRGLETTPIRRGAGQPPSARPVSNPPHPHEDPLDPPKKTQPPPRPGRSSCQIQQSNPIRPILRMPSPKPRRRPALGTAGACPPHHPPPNRGAPPLAPTPLVSSAWPAAFSFVGSSAQPAH